MRTGVADSDTHVAHARTQSGFPRTHGRVAHRRPGRARRDRRHAVAATSTTGAPSAPTRRWCASRARRRVDRPDGAASSSGFPTEIATTDGAVDVHGRRPEPALGRVRPRRVLREHDDHVLARPTRQSGAGPGDRCGATRSRRTSCRPRRPTSPSPPWSSVPGHFAPARPRRRSRSTGLTEDVWVVVMVRGTDGVSRPLFPVLPNSLQTSGNTTLANLTDGNLGEDGMHGARVHEPALRRRRRRRVDAAGRADGRLSLSAQQHPRAALLALLGVVGVRPRRRAALAAPARSAAPVPPRRRGHGHARARASTTAGWWSRTSGPTPCSRATPGRERSRSSRSTTAVEPDAAAAGAARRRCSSRARRTDVLAGSGTAGRAAVLAARRRRHGAHHEPDAPDRRGGGRARGADRGR